MKTRPLRLVVLSLLLAGCALSPPDTRPRFHGTSQASVVLQFNSWDHVCMIKPACLDAQFLRLIHRQELPGVFDEMRVPRDTAVVSLSWLFKGEALQAILSDWKQVLRQSGFRRVVFVQGTACTSVERAIIIEECDLR